MIFHFIMRISKKNDYQREIIVLILLAGPEVIHLIVFNHFSF